METAAINGNKQKNSNSDILSQMSESDNFPKTEGFETVVNISKLYLGIGVLAYPYGF